MGGRTGRILSGGWKGAQVWSAVGGEKGRETWRRGNLRTGGGGWKRAALWGRCFLFIQHLRVFMCQKDHFWLFEFWDFRHDLGAPFLK